MDSKNAARLFAALLNDTTFEDAVVQFATELAVRHEKETLRYVREDNARQAALSAARAETWERLLSELKAFAKKYQSGE